MSRQPANLPEAIQLVAGCLHRLPAKAPGIDHYYGAALERRRLQLVSAGFIVRIVPPVAITFAGVTATSAVGLDGAMRVWIETATAVLARAAS
jgi:hypothetical protein